MAAGKYDFTIEQGTTVKLDFVWKTGAGDPISLAGYTARMQVRSVITDATALLDLTTVNGKLTIPTPSNGTIHLQLSATESAAITWLTGVYDLEVVSGTGDVTRLLKGAITVDQEVTRT